MPECIPSYDIENNRTGWVILYFSVIHNHAIDQCSIKFTSNDGLQSIITHAVTVEYPGNYSVILFIPKHAKRLEIVPDSSGRIELNIYQVKHISLLRLLVQFSRRSIFLIYKEGITNYISNRIRSFSKAKASECRINHLLSLKRQIDSYTNYHDWLVVNGHSFVINESDFEQELLATIKPLTLDELAADHNLINSIDAPWILLSHNAVVVYPEFYTWVTNELPNLGNTTQLVYFDHDYVVDNKRTQPVLKSEWDEFQFRHWDYLGDCILVNTAWLRSVLNDNQFLDVVPGKSLYSLAFIAGKLGEITYAPVIGFGSREHSFSFTDEFYSEANRFTKLTSPFATQIARQELSTNCIYIIIPTRDNLEYISRAVTSVNNNTIGVDYHIVIVDNQSVDADVLTYFEKVSQQGNTDVIQFNHEFNYSAINNFAVKFIKENFDGKFVLLLNDDTEVVNDTWLAEMMACLLLDNTGVVGAKLYYPDNRIQHAGVTIGTGGVAGHTFKYVPGHYAGPFNQLNTIRRVSAVTAACLLTHVDVFDEVNGLDEVNLTVAFNDIDYCLKVRQAGYKIYWTPYAELIHHESVSRGFDHSGANRARYRKEVKYMRVKWQTHKTYDPFYNQHLALNTEFYRLAHQRRNNK